MYVITGATGNTGKPIAHALLQAGKQVRVVGRETDKLKEFAGAEIAVGNLENVDFVKEIFQGAQAVYAMIPPKFNADDFTAYQKLVADNLAHAVRENQVPYVVTLSSFGGHLSENGGVVKGVAYLENVMNGTQAHVLNLRPGFFYQNLYGSVGIIKQMGALAGFPIQGDVKLAMIHVKDIADHATKRLLALDFTGKSTQFLAGERDLTFQEVAQVLGKAIGKPDLNWVAFDYEGARQGMVQMGMSPDLAANYVEFCQRANDGSINDGFRRDADNTTPTSIEQFAQEFAYVYNQ